MIFRDAPLHFTGEEADRALLALDPMPEATAEDIELARAIMAAGFEPLEPGDSDEWDTGADHIGEQEYDERDDLNGSDDWELQ